MGERIKVTDKRAIELGKTLLGYRIVLDNMALRWADTGLEFWGRLRELHKLDTEKRYRYDHFTNEIIEDE